MCIYAYIFGKGHLSTLGASRDSLKKAPRVETFGEKEESKNCISRRSQSRKMTFPKISSTQLEEILILLYAYMYISSKSCVVCNTHIYVCIYVISVFVMFAKYMYFGFLTVCVLEGTVARQQ